MEKLTKEIMAGRDSANKKERITKNTILRAYIDAPGGLDIGKENIADEAELLRRIKEMIKWCSRNCVKMREQRMET